MDRTRITLLFLLFTAMVASPAVCLEQSAEKGWIGILLTRPEAETSGVGISRVVNDGPAAEAGLRAGDVILAIDGVETGSTAGLIGTIGGKEPGGWVTLRIDRRGKEKEIRVRLDNRPASLSGLQMREGWIGVDAIDLPPALREHFGSEPEAGVMVSAVEETGPAFVAGLELGDVVFSVNGRPVRSAGHLKGLIGGGGVDNTVEITLMRSGVEITVEAMVARRPD